MKHIASENRILISLDELVSVARRRISPILPTDENEPEISGASRIFLSSLGVRERLAMTYDTDYNGISYRISGYVPHFLCSFAFHDPVIFFPAQSTLNK